MEFRSALKMSACERAERRWTR